jgi:hypothetical protein
VNYKHMEEVRGFLGHLAMTYDIIAMYLKGLHLTLVSHHSNRDKDGWKLSKKDWMSYLWDARDKGTLSLDEFSKLFDMAIKSNNPVMTKGEKILSPPPK